MANVHPEDGSFLAKREPPPFANLVALHVRWPGNRLDDSFPLNLILEVEEHHLLVPLKPRLLQKIRNLPGRANAPDEELRLRIRLRYCYVRHHSDDIEISPESKYQSMILEGKFQTHMSETLHTASRRNFGAKLGGSAGLKHTGVDASLEVGGHAGFAKGHDRTFEVTKTKTPDVYEVRAVPNGWRVGDAGYGDPNQPSSCLDGRYFDRPVPGVSHTCQASFLDGRDRGALTFTVTVRRGGLDVQRIGGGGGGGQQEAAAVNAMRDQIAALRLERSLHSVGSAKEQDDEELPIETVICQVMRAAGGEPTNALPAGLESRAPTQKEPAPLVRKRRRSAVP